MAILQIIFAGVIFIAIIVAGSIAQGATPPLKDSQPQMLTPKILLKAVEELKKQGKKK